MNFHVLAPVSSKTICLRFMALRLLRHVLGLALFSQLLLARSPLLVPDYVHTTPHGSVENGNVLLAARNCCRAIRQSEAFGGAPPAFTRNGVAGD